MSASRSLRRWIPLVSKAHNTTESRSFHASVIMGAARPAKKSPKVKAATRIPTTATSSARPRQGATPDSVEESLPPLALLKSAQKAGVMTVEPAAALEFLRIFHQSVGASNLASSVNTALVQRLCNEHQLTSSTMALLGGILKRCPSPKQRMLALKLMLSASALGEKSATFEIVSQAMKDNLIEAFPAPMQQLGLSAKKEHDPQAMTLLGKVLYSRRAEKEALEWFRKATQPPHGSLDFFGAGDALVYEGRILKSMDDIEGAKAAFEKAALQLDDPSAYFYLSQLQEPGSPQQKIYLLKAASSGATEAWHNLGAIELAEIEKRPERPKSMADYGMAKEWFEVAAADGFGLSMLNLASMCRAIGEMDEGLKWLEKAEKIPSTQVQAQGMRNQWSGKTTWQPKRKTPK